MESQLPGGEPHESRKTSKSIRHESRNVWARGGMLVAYRYRYDLSGSYGAVPFTYSFIKDTLINSLIQRVRNNVGPEFVSF
jgi:hypothetical protein